ncbi:MAG: hydroxymethylglutaryl-CoA reductase, degradative [Chitinophagales bacterium]|nr:hydroxymethylglutaryl-CoA reductase, degradative [Chitinophagales bacterium]
MRKVSSFSKLSKYEKISWLAKNFLYESPVDVINNFAGFWYDNVEIQKQFDGFSENTISNFHLPFGVAPNFLIDGKDYVIPMVTEESSVVAAVSNAAKFWMERGGITAKVIDTQKLGQVHFFFGGSSAKLKTFFEAQKKDLILSVADLTANMEKRGGGLLNLDLLDMTSLEPNYYQFKVAFETCDSMGANFINSVLERLGSEFRKMVAASDKFTPDETIEINMCILSNYTPDCLVEASVSCKIEDLGIVNGFAPQHFADKFTKAVRIAEIDVHRATTHNKGILNGIDSLVIATGNDFRAVESCIHTYAARDGQYRSLSKAWIDKDMFHFSLRFPIALGTVGGLTSLHPLAKTSLQILGNPSAKELMKIAAAVGLMQNFAAVRSLTTTGIQLGHMKMHLTNIIAELKANLDEAKQIETYFADKVISVSEVRNYLQKLRESISPKTV